MARPRFAHELNWLIRKHTAKLRYGDDFVPIISALYETADKLAVKADGRPWKDDEPAQVKRRRKTAA